MEQQPPINSSYNVLPVFKTSKVYMILSFIIFLMILGMFMLIYDVQPPSDTPSTDKPREKIAYSVIVIMFFIIAIIILSSMFLPDFYNISDFFFQIKWASLIILYTIFLILFFRLTPVDIVNKYANIILPITALIGIILFYKGFSTNYIFNFNVNYERIKIIIMLVCFITIIGLYYNFDPGNYITKYFGSLLMPTFVLIIFILLYIITLLTIPDKIGLGATNFLSNFTSFTVYNAILFVIFIIVMTIIIMTYPQGFVDFTKDKPVGALILLLLIVILWVILIISNLYVDFSGQINDTKFDIFKKTLLILFGLVISGFLIYWIVYNAQSSFSKESGIISFVLNLLIVLIVLTLIYRTMNVKIPSPKDNYKKNAFFDLITQFIFYIPCIFSDGVDSALRFTSENKGYASTEKSSFIILLGVIALILFYVFGPNLYNKFYLQGGNLLVNNPVNTNKEYSLGTYEELNGSETFDYQYALSSWFFINSDAPNTNESYSKYTPLLNFGGKPNVLYNGSTNTLMVTMSQKDLKKTTTNNLLEFDEDGNRILYIKHNVLLQKWNNIIINYNGGILDIFLNGELVKSDIGVVPYYTLDSLTIGKDGGIHGGICNVVYFKKALTAMNVYLLYNVVKNKTPPVTNDSNLTIMKQNFKTLSNSYEETI